MKRPRYAYVMYAPKSTKALETSLNNYVDTQPVTVHVRVVSVQERATGEVYVLFEHQEIGMESLYYGKESL